MYSQIILLAVIMIIIGRLIGMWREGDNIQ